MAVTNPKRVDQTAYAGSTFNFLYDFEDGNDNPIDLAAVYNDIEYRIFRPGRKASPEVSLTVSGGGLSITNTNELSGTVTATQTEEMPAVVYHEYVFTLADGDPEVFIFGRYFVENVTTGSGEQEANASFTINQTTNNVTLSDSYDAAAKATQAKVDAQTAETNAEQAESGAVSAKNDAETAESNTQALLGDAEFITSQIVKSDHVPVYDNFNRADGVLGTAPSGQTWVDSQSTAAIITDVGDGAESGITAKLAGLNNLSTRTAGVGLISDSELILSERQQRKLSSHKVGKNEDSGFEIGHIIAYKDDNNFVYAMQVDARRLELYKVEAGVTTQLVNYSGSGAGGNGDYLTTMVKTFESGFSRQANDNLTVYAQTITSGGYALVVHRTSASGGFWTDMFATDTVGIIVSGQTYFANFITEKYDSIA